MDPVPNVLVNNNQPVTLNPGKDDGTFARARSAPTRRRAPTPSSCAATAQVPYTKDPMAKQKPPVQPSSSPRRRSPSPCCRRRSATVTADQCQRRTLKVGTQGEVVVKVTRQFDYAGEFKVQLVLPPNVKGMSAADVVDPGRQGRGEAGAASAPPTPRPAAAQRPRSSAPRRWSTATCRSCRSRQVQRQCGEITAVEPPLRGCA